MIKRPMLASPTKEAELRALKWPKLISAKIDGIRALVIERDGKPVLVSRKLIEIPNRHAQHLFARPEFVGLDGELVLGEPWAKDCYRKTNSAAMTAEGEPDLKLYVFDSFSGLREPYAIRAREARQLVYLLGRKHSLVWVQQVGIYSYEEMLEQEEGYLSRGYEGAMLRCPRGPYKEGRSTLRQEWLLKVKRFVDDEAEVIGTTELRRNNNEATTDETGYTKRSTHKAGKADGGTLGTLTVKGKTGQFEGVEFEIGTGFTAEQRQNLWDGRKYLVGKVVTYKHFPIGVKDKPRHPVFLRFRDART